MPAEFVTGGEFETWPGITATKGALDGADDAAKEENKFPAFDPHGGG